MKEADSQDTLKYYFPGLIIGGVIGGFMGIFGGNKESIFIGIIAGCLVGEIFGLALAKIK